MRTNMHDDPVQRAQLPLVIGQCLAQTPQPSTTSRRALLALRAALQDQPRPEQSQAEHCGQSLAPLNLSEDEADQLGMVCWLGAVACLGEESAALEHCAAFFATVIEHALSLQRVRPMPIGGKGR